MAYHECESVTVSVLFFEDQNDVILILVSIVTGMTGPLGYSLGLRDCSLVILFFSILCTIPVAYLATLGPKTGMRQMIQARFSFG